MVEPSPPGAVENLLNYIGQDFTQLDPVQIETMLSMGGESPVLVNDEKVLMAFKCGRDMTIFTTKGTLNWESESKKKCISVMVTMYDFHDFLTL